MRERWALALAPLLILVREFEVKQSRYVVAVVMKIMTFQKFGTPAGDRCIWNWKENVYSV